jgi:hypothetical protein
MPGDKPNQKELKALFDCVLDAMSDAAQKAARLKALRALDHDTRLYMLLCYFIEASTQIFTENDATREDIAEIMAEVLRRSTPVTLQPTQDASGSFCDVPRSSSCGVPLAFCDIMDIDPDEPPKERQH